MSNDLDELMDKDPLSLSSQDIDTIIAYQRNQRAQREAGVKAPRGKAKGLNAEPGKKLDLAALGLRPTPSAATAIKRRI